MFFAKKRQEFSDNLLLKYPAEIRFGSLLPRVLGRGQEPRAVLSTPVQRHLQASRCSREGVPDCCATLTKWRQGTGRGKLCEPNRF